MDINQKIKVISEVLKLEGIAFTIVRNAVCLDQDLHQYNMCEGYEFDPFSDDLNIKAMALDFLEKYKVTYQPEREESHGYARCGSHMPQVGSNPTESIFLAVHYTYCT